MFQSVQMRKGAGRRLLEAFLTITGAFGLPVRLLPQHQQLHVSAASRGRHQLPALMWTHEMSKRNNQTNRVRLQRRRPLRHVLVASAGEEGYCTKTAPPFKNRLTNNKLQLLSTF